MSEVITGRRPGEICAAVKRLPEWREPETTTYRCPVHLLPEDDGGYSVYAATLPGIASQGRTIAEALDNIVEAIGGAIASYRQYGEKIPWLETPRELESRELVRWVEVHG